jgi:methionine-gamma-lyase
MSTFHSGHGMSTLVIHHGEHEDALHAHVTPIYQTSTFAFEDADSGAALFRHERPGYIYTRLGNPNQAQAVRKIAALEGFDLLRAQPQRSPEELVDGHLFSSGMAAITTAILAKVKQGQTVIAQRALYSATFNFLHSIAPRFGINVIWLSDPSPEQWERAFAAHPDAVLAVAETPANPTLALTDLRAVSEIAHRYGAWVMVDNTFATPFCQRPLTLGCDLVVHSTTKYLSGHGAVVGGAVVSHHLDFVQNELRKTLETLGGSAGPFDAWLTSLGLKTFELRMKAHCENARQVAEFLSTHPAVERVFYPALPSHPQHDLAKRQMHAFGGMVSFELKGGLEAGKAMMNRVRVCVLAVSLGNLDTLISHPASMTHTTVPPEERHRMGITDGLVRLSVGVENVEDIIADLDRAMR